MPQRRKGSTPTSLSNALPRLRRGALLPALRELFAAAAEPRTPAAAAAALVLACLRAGEGPEGLAAGDVAPNFALDAAARAEAREPKAGEKVPVATGFSTNR